MHQDPPNRTRFLPLGAIRSIIILLFAVLAHSLPARAAKVMVVNKKAIEVSAAGAAKVTVSPPKGANAGMRRTSRIFKIKNVSKEDFYVYGYNKEFVLIQVHTKNPDTGKWEKRSVGYCGTGVGMHLVRPGESFTAEVSLIGDLAKRPFQIEFSRYAGKDFKTATVERTETLGMGKL